MRVALFSDTFLPTVNGVVSSIINYSRGLAAEGHQVLVVIPDHPELKRDYVLAEGVKVIRLTSVDGKIYPDLRLGVPTLGVYKEVREFAPDVIHSFTPGVIGLMAVVLGRRLKKKVVFTHGTRFDDEQVLKAVRRFDIGFLRRLHRGVGALLTRYLNLHDQILVSTEDTMRSLDERNVKKPVTVLPLPVDITDFVMRKKEGKKWRGELGISLGMMYVGRMSGEKQIDQVLKLFSRVCASFEGLRLILVGGGPERKRLFELAAQLGINHRIIWIDEMDYETLARKGTYYLGDILVMMSEWETLGLSVVEGMACGVVPVGKEKTAVGEVIGHAGVVVDASDKNSWEVGVTKLLSDDKWRNKLSRMARRRAQDYEVGKCTQGLVGFYEKVLGT